MIKELTTQSPKTFIAFLRGINVGGKNKIAMADLRDSFEIWGFSNIATFLASGNICFDSSLKSAEEIRQTIEKGIKKSFGLEIQTMARSLEDLKRLAARAPFFDYPVPDDIRFYMSFLGSPNSTSLEIPFKSPGGGLEIPLVIEGEVFSMVRLS